MSRFSESTLQYCPVRIFQPKPLEPVTIYNSNNRQRDEIPQCDGTNGAIFFSVCKLLKCAGNRGTLTTTGGAHPNTYSVANAWRDALKLVPGPNNSIWTDILDGYANQTRANLYAAAGEFVAQMSGQ